MCNKELMHRIATAVKLLDRIENDTTDSVIRELARDAANPLRSYVQDNSVIVSKILKQ